VDQGETLRIFPLKIGRDLVQISLLGITNRPGITRPLFDLLERHGAAVKFLIEGCREESTSDLIFCITRDDLRQLRGGLHDIRERLQPRALVIRNRVAVVRMLGPHFDIQPGTSGMLFTALIRAGVEICSNATTITSSTCVIPDEQVEEAERAIARTFAMPGSKS
jgi:aspartate kinase